MAKKAVEAPKGLSLDEIRQRIQVNERPIWWL